jgi:hypothetical protein
MARGKAALRDGRALLRTPGAEAAAENALTAAVAAFDEASAAASAGDGGAAAAAGNAGNALSALATLRARLAAEATDAQAAASYADTADAAWVAAGERYRAVAAATALDAEAGGGGGGGGGGPPADARALVSWARALAARADLALTWPDGGAAEASSTRAERLLESAAAKLDAVLAADPADGRAAREAGLVLARLASLKPPGSPSERAALQDAVAAFGDARAAGALDGDEAAEAAAAEAGGRLRELMAVGPPPPAWG